MSLGFKMRDVFFPRERILEETGIKPGWFVVDYGCGPGGCVAPLSRIVGEKGMVYAVDIHPLAVKMTKDIIARMQLKNACADLLEGNSINTPDKSVDAALLYDLLHDLEDADTALKELHRILKTGGIVSLTDHHLGENDIVDKMQRTGLFMLEQKGRKTYTFKKKSD